MRRLLFSGALSKSQALLIAQTLFALSIFGACTSSSDSGGAPDASDGASPDAGTRRDGSADAAFEASTRPVNTCSASATALPPDAGVCNGNCNSVTIYNFNPSGFATQYGEGYFSSQSGSIDTCDLPACASMSQLYYKSGSNYDVAVSGLSIYWTVNSREIWTSDDTGAGAHSIVTTTTDISPHGLAVSGSTIYWSFVPNTIEACDTSNCAATQHDLIPASEAAGPLGLAVSDKLIFWTDYSDISMSNLDGSNVQTLVTGLSPDAIAVDGCGLYWSSGATVWTCKTSDCTNTTRLLATVSPAPGFASLGADGTNVYFVDRDFQQMYVIPEPQ